MSTIQQTRGGLVPARIVPVNENGNAVAGRFGYNSYGEPNLYGPELIVNCMFNPEEYTIKKKNKFETGGTDAAHRNAKNYKLEYQTDKVEPRTLTLSALWFDTSEEFRSDGSPVDVRTYTNPLFEYVELQSIRGTVFASYPGNLNPPPLAAFEWGSFRFLGAIDSVKVDFSLFAPDGTPIQAKATVSFKEFRHRMAYPNQNPSSGAAMAERHWHVRAGDRLDRIAAEVYGDASLWRLLARHNGIHDPLALTPGQQLSLPARWQLRMEAAT
ncbi:MAG: LysM peptidoglycan-binding domain-containing protein [Ardenticatenales bacterium]|nr:LysM peptidoglycan-binding domain-containing protein [Ardenticatenales bacterium]